MVKSQKLKVKSKKSVIPAQAGIHVFFLLLLFTFNLLPFTVLAATIEGNKIVCPCENESNAGKTPFEVLSGVVNSAYRDMNTINNTQGPIVDAIGAKMNEIETLEANGQPSDYQRGELLSLIAKSNILMVLGQYLTTRPMKGDLKDAGVNDDFSNIVDVFKSVFGSGKCTNDATCYIDSDCVSGGCNSRTQRALRNINNLLAISNSLLTEVNAARIKPLVEALINLKSALSSNVSTMDLQ